MKIAFCFLTLAEPHHPGVWEAFFADAPSDAFTLYCHPKEPERVTSSLLAGRIIAERVPTRQGDVSIVAATLALYEAAYRDDPDNEYFVLVSESTIPIARFAAIRDELERAAQRSLIPYSVPPPGSEHHQRLNSVANNAIFADAFYFHDQWVVLHRRHVAALLDRSYLPHFAKLFAADEHYIMNVLVHAQRVPLDQVISRRTTYANWKDREVRLYKHSQTGIILGRTDHPKTYGTLAAADLAAAQDCWFFRKVAASCDCSLALERLRPPAPPAG